MIARRLLRREPVPPSGGVTLIELIAFIAIAGVVAVALVQAFSGTMRGSHFGKEMTQGTQLAQQRMEVILGQRKTLGYAAFIASADYDPCQSSVWAGQLCSTSSYAAGNFSVASTRSAADACGTGCTEVTVTVASPYGAVTGSCVGSDVLACLAAEVWNY